MSTNTADTVRSNLKKAIKGGRTECGAIAANLEKFINEALWEYLDLPGETPADKLHALVTLPFNQAGLNCKIEEVDALLSLNTSVQRKYRALVFEAKQGERTDLKPETKVKAKIPQKKSKSISNSQKANVRAANRAVEAVPELEELLDNDLVSQRNAAKLGQVIKDPENPTEKEKKTIQQRKKVAQQLKQIVPKPLPEDLQAKNELRQKVKQTIEETTGKKAVPKVFLSKDPQKTAKAIAKKKSDIGYLEELVVSIQLEIQAMQPHLANAA